MPSWIYNSPLSFAVLRVAEFPSHPSLLSPKIEDLWDYCFQVNTHVSQSWKHNIWSKQILKKKGGFKVFPTK